MATSWSEATNGRSGVTQPMRCHSPTYQGFEVSFHRALDSTMKTGAQEMVRPAHIIHGCQRGTRAA
jgi:hypothetical protein